MIISTAEVYSDGARQRPFFDMCEETPMDGMTASAIAIKVVHCDSVRTWPSGGGGRGASRGEMRFSCVLVIVLDTSAVFRALGEGSGFDSLYRNHQFKGHLVGKASAILPPQCGAI